MSITSTTALLLHVVLCCLLIVIVLYQQLTTTVRDSLDPSNLANYNINNNWMKVKKCQITTYASVPVLVNSASTLYSVSLHYRSLSLSLCLHYAQIFAVLLNFIYSWSIWVPFVNTFAAV